MESAQSYGERVFKPRFYETAQLILCIFLYLFNELIRTGLHTEYFCNVALKSKKWTIGLAQSVCTFFHCSVMWQKIYMSEFGTQTWRPKSVDNAALKDDPEDVGDLSAGNWKRLYFRTTAGYEMNKWRRELRENSPYTGLPRQTEWVLRYERQSSSDFSGAAFPVW